MEEIGRVPEEGDHFVYENLDVTVTRVDHRRVLEIRVVVLPQGRGHRRQGPPISPYMRSARVKSQALFHVQNGSATTAGTTTSTAKTNHAETKE